MPRYERILPLIAVVLMGLGLILLVERIHTLSLVIPLPVENLPWVTTSSWEIQTVDGLAGVGYGTSLDLGTSGHVHLSYYDSGREELRYAVHDGTRWITTTVASAGGIGVYTSLALNVDEHPHIAFYNAASADLDYVRYDGTAWLTATVDRQGDVGRYASLALDSAGLPHIAYYDMVGGDLRYAHFDGTAWMTETVDAAGDVGRYASLAVDGQDRSHISYYDATHGQLRYASYDGSGWVTMTVDSAGQVGWYTALALDSAGLPRISYYDAATGDLLYARYEGTFWISVVVDAIGDVGQYTSLVLDSEDRPSISYLGDNVLRYAHFDGTAWRVETVDSVGSVGTATSLAVGPDLRPRIGYSEATHGDLRYASTGHGMGFEARVSIAWLILFSLLVVMIVGAESLYHTEEEVEAAVAPRRRLRFHLHPVTWILPGLLTLSAFLFLRLLRSIAARSVGLGVAGLLLFVALLAQHYSRDERPQVRLMSRQGLDVLAYLAAFFLYWSIYTLKLRSLISATSIVLLTVMLAYVMLQWFGQRRQILPYAAVVGLCVGEITWPLNYWAISGLSGGTFLLVIFYTVSNLVRHHLQGTLTARVAVEYIGVGLLGSAVIGFYAFWPR